MGIISPIATDGNGNPIATGSAKVLGKDDFLQLLVTQLTHQDPMNPMDDTEFIAQLSQFSSLEQLQNMNEAINNSLEWDYLQMQTINNTMATSLIGKDVKASFNNLYMDDENLPKINYNNADYAESVKIEIMNMDGVVVRTLTQEDVAAGSNTIEWDGKDENGDRVAEGFYSVSISAIDGEGDSFTPSTFVEGRVNGVVYRNGSAYLQVNGLEIPLADVTSIEEAKEEG